MINLLTKNQIIVLFVAVDPSPVNLYPSCKEPYVALKGSRSSALTFFLNQKYNLIGKKTTTRLEKSVSAKSKMSLGVSKRGYYQLNIMPIHMSK